MSIRLAGILAAGAVALAGCVSVLPEPTAPGTLYRLDLTEPAARLRAHVLVREPEASRLIGGSGMVVEGTDGGLRLMAGAEWAGRASELMQVALIEALSDPAAEGMALSASTGAPADYELAWRIADLTLRGQDARCRLHLTLLDGRSREPLARTQADGVVGAASGDTQARARALKSAARACVADAARQIAERATPVR